MYEYKLIKYYSMYFVQPVRMVNSKRCIFIYVVIIELFSKAKPKKK